MTRRYLLIATAALAAADLACSDDDPDDNPACEITSTIPGDVADGAGQPEFDTFSWQSFIAVNAATADGAGTPQWAGWSSTADYLNLVAAWSGAGAAPADFPAFGARFYPEACLAYCQAEGLDCTDHRTLETVGKVDDAIFEANATGLSSDPVIAANATFLRYEIRMNRDMYDLVSQGELYRTANVVAESVDGTCGASGGPPAPMARRPVSS